MGKDVQTRHGLEPLRLQGGGLYPVQEVRSPVVVVNKRILRVDLSEFTPDLYSSNENVACLRICKMNDLLKKGLAFYKAAIFTK